MNEMMIPGPSVQHLCKLFNCTPAQVATQYDRNATQLREMRDEAARRGKKYRGNTAEFYAERAAFFSMKASEARFVAAAVAAE